MRSLCFALFALPALVACGGNGDEEDDALSPNGDEDGDGFTNGEEEDLGSDPLDDADVPYAGGWDKGQCRDNISPTGNGVGQIAEDFTLVDQFGEDWHLHDFCHEVVLLEFSGFS